MSFAFYLWPNAGEFVVKIDLLTNMWDVNYLPVGCSVGTSVGVRPHHWKMGGPIVEIEQSNISNYGAIAIAFTREKKCGFC